ncbi:hypothetical protein [Vibrio fluvialis]|uniref:hypothetical protein n=1 Tax=Vibrio fluvialis TaxID=676 RepID=UPI0028F73A83|nr:hypothetical protein [Vibrio fluvialis]
MILFPYCITNATLLWMTTQYEAPFKPSSIANHLTNALLKLKLGKPKAKRTTKPATKRTARPKSAAPMMTYDAERLVDDLAQAVQYGMTYPARCRRWLSLYGGVLDTRTAETQILYKNGFKLLVDDYKAMRLSMQSSLPKPTKPQ